MNNIIKTIQDNSNIEPAFNIDILKTLKCETRKSKCVKEGIVCHWYVTIDNKQVKLNRNKKDPVRLNLTVKCKECGKILKNNVNITKVFSFKREYINYWAPDRCKRCNNTITSRTTLGKRIENNLKKYGVKHVTQLPGSGIKRHRTKQLKYGVNYAKENAKRNWEKYYLKTGFKHNTHNPESLKRRVESWRETVENMPLEKKKEWHNKRMNAYREEGSPGMFGTNNVYPYRGVSKISKEFFEMLIKEYTNQEKIILEGNIDRYKVDCLIEGVCVLEFYGDYWHGNPLIYSVDDKLKRPGGTAMIIRDIWTRDAERIECILHEKQLPVIIVWERTFRQDKKGCINRTLQEITNLKGKTQNDPRIIVY